MRKGNPPAGRALSILRASLCHKSQEANLRLTVLTRGMRDGVRSRTGAVADARMRAHATYDRAMCNRYYPARREIYWAEFRAMPPENLPRPDLPE